MIQLSVQNTSNRWFRNPRYSPNLTSTATPRSCFGCHFFHDTTWTRCTFKYCLPLRGWSSKRPTSSKSRTKLSILVNEIRVFCALSPLYLQNIRNTIVADSTFLWKSLKISALFGNYSMLPRTNDEPKSVKGFITSLIYIKRFSMTCECLLSVTLKSIFTIHSITIQTPSNHTRANWKTFRASLVLVFFMFAQIYDTLGTLFECDKKNIDVVETGKRICKQIHLRNISLNQILFERNFTKTNENWKHYSFWRLWNFTDKKQEWFFCTTDLTWLKIKNQRL